MKPMFRLAVRLQIAAITCVTAGILSPHDEATPILLLGVLLACASMFATAYDLYSYKRRPTNEAE